MNVIVIAQWEWIYIRTVLNFITNKAIFAIFAIFAITQRFVMLIYSSSITAGWHFCVRLCTMAMDGYMVMAFETLAPSVNEILHLRFGHPSSPNSHRPHSVAALPFTLKERNCWEESQTDLCKPPYKILWYLPSTLYTLITCNN